MSENKVPYGNEAAEWERDAQELRGLIEAAGYTNAAAAEELGIPERAFRGLVNGREPVPRAVLYAARWLREHKRNERRFLEVHWRRAGLTVQRGDTFSLVETGPQIQFLVNGESKIRGKLADLIDAGVVSMHTSPASNRLELQVPITKTTAREPHEPDVRIGRFGYYVKGGENVSPMMRLCTWDGRVDLSVDIATSTEAAAELNKLELNLKGLRESVMGTFLGLPTKSVPISS